MSTNKVIKNLEKAINRICSDIDDKKGGSGADKMNSLSKLVNSYSRLIERSKDKEVDPMMDGNPAYYESLTKQNDRSNVLR
ncbi:MAG: hypothetical protein GX625_08155 [Clostridiaceae bacterium]|nr:hypothetical protein [Clostridiaceae bacterium]